MTWSWCKRLPGFPGKGWPNATPEISRKVVTHRHAKNCPIWIKHISGTKDACTGRMTKYCENISPKEAVEILPKTAWPTARTTGYTSEISGMTWKCDVNPSHYLNEMSSKKERTETGTKRRDQLHVKTLEIPKTVEIPLKRGRTKSGTNVPKYERTWQTARNPCGNTTLKVNQLLNRD